VEAYVAQKPYDTDLPTASPEAYEERVAFLARAAAELADYYEGIVFTLRMQRDAANAELRELRATL